MRTRKRLLRMQKAWLWHSLRAAICKLRYHNIELFTWLPRRFFEKIILHFTFVSYKTIILPFFLEINIFTNVRGDLSFSSLSNLVLKDGWHLVGVRDSSLKALGWGNWWHENVPTNSYGLVNLRVKILRKFKWRLYLLFIFVPFFSDSLQGLIYVVRSVH